jgi:hypothetical protein
MELLRKASRTLGIYHIDRGLSADCPARC